MSKGIVHTYAGDDSDGKVWGIEGVNLVFMLAGLLLSIGLALLLSRQHAPMLSVGAGAMPFVLVTVYVFTLRQGRPKSFDSDLIETLSSGSCWMSAPHQPRNSLSSYASTKRLVH